MLLEQTIVQLDTGPVCPDRAWELGKLGYRQWLDALPGHLDYRREAERARALARPFKDVSPAVAVFCALLTASILSPLVPLPLGLPARKRRGGARARRAAL
ncbi:MAG: hypothetical protein KGI94_00325 [Paracoccaceae bacterium]|nr:hypothetical protein [Paracoccaceae bacterium]MDE3123362.1 hypothetical protein [Paracoccaceae bacterium]MDE3240750.1 hypothetical protein [Paracoccaceae bacterium]